MLSTARALIACLMLLEGAAAAVAAPAGTGSRQPACRQVRGTAAVTFTRDEGRILTPTVQRLSGVSYTYGLVALPGTNRLLAAVGSRIIASRDGGCGWEPIANLERRTGDALVSLSAAPGNHAYAWVVNGSALFRIDGRRVVTLRAPIESIVGIGVDADDWRSLHLVDRAGGIWTSRDGGRRWAALGLPPRPDLFVYRAAFAPGDPDHVVLGTSLDGAYVSRDGGRTWRRSAGLTTDPAAQANVFNVVVSPRDSEVVWAMGIDLGQTDGPAEGKHIYASADGGSSFAPVVDHGGGVGGVVLINGPTMAAHPTNPGVLYFVFGTFFLDYGTDIYRYDAATDQLTKTHNDHDDVSAIAFSATAPSVMYLGLVSEQVD